MMPPKILVAADSKMGKTSLLATLANAGYNLRVMDFDNGAEILDDYLTPEGMERTSILTFEDDSPDLRTGTSAWGKFQNVFINGWKDSEEDLGKLSTWTSQDVLAIDTLSFMARAAMRFAIRTAGRSPETQAQIQDYGELARLVESKIAWLTSRAFPGCLVVNTHITTIEDEMGRSRMYPAALGKAIPLVCARYFNSLIRLDRKITKNGNELVIRTVSDTKMALGTSVPNKLEPEEPPDLSLLFEKIRGDS